MNILRTFLQLLKFGISGIAGVAISTLLFYGFRERLPTIIWILGFWYWVYPLDIFDMGFYILTTIIGGTVHFIISKFWVFDH